MVRQATARATANKTSDHRGGWSRASLERAYRDHSGPVYAVARGICGDRVAADVTAEVFLQLRRHPEQLQPGQGSLRVSLLTITHGVAVDTVRAESRAEVRARAEEAPDADPGDRHQLHAHLSENSNLDAPLDLLHLDQREAIVMTHYGRCTYGEAAVVLGVDEATVKSRIREGLRRLRVAAASARDNKDGTGVRELSTSDRGLGEALDCRRVVAQAQGIIMEREGCTAAEAYCALLLRSDQLGSSLPACADAVVASASDPAQHARARRADPQHRR